MRVVARSVVLVVGLFVLGWSGTFAGAQTPSAEQLELLKNLTPEQREALLEQMAGGTLGSSASKTTQDRDRPAGEEGADEESREALEQRARMAEEPLIKTLKAADSVLIDLGLRAKPLDVPGAIPPVVEPDVELTVEERKKLAELVDLIRQQNPYRLDRNGALQLPGFVAIPLAGLTEEQATVRLRAEPALRRLYLKLIRLPLDKVGSEALKPFGYDLFEAAPSSFAPVTNMPVPADYVVGPGDQLNVQLYGSQNRNLTLTVGRDGRINFPELGPISVGGQRFSSVAASLESRVQRQMIGVRASVAIGDTRSIRVFVLGEAKRPGSYTVSGLATVTTALFASGGVKPIGSLRDIQLKRQGAVVRRLDLYDLLLKGDTSNDAKLLAGDVIFVPPVAATVAVDGEVKRPAIYELRGDTDVAGLLQLAGGLTPDADPSRGALTRLDEQRRRVVVDVDFEMSEARTQRLRNGDSLRVPRVRPQLDSGVLVQGYLFNPGTVAWREGLRLSDVLTSVDELRPGADLGYILIRRELQPDRRIVALSADLSAALRNRGGEADPRLNPRDQITVFDFEPGRERVIRPLLEEIRLQSRLDRPTAIVRVGGRVKVPGEYPLEPNMTVSDLIRAGGNLSDAAYGGQAELTRYGVDAGDVRRTELIEIDLAKVLAGDNEADVALRPFDFLNIKEVPEWSVQEQATLAGEVRFPGTYPIKRGETLDSLLRRAGGLTDLAFPEGAVFTRKELQEREQQQLDLLATRLQGDLASLALQGAAANQQGAGQALTVGQSLLSQLRSSKAVGRLVIDLDRSEGSGAGSASDLVLRNGDTLLIPKRRQEVTVIGEVQNTTSHLFQDSLSRDDYISLSGGTTRKADRGKIYIVRANGSVVANEGSRWFRRATNVAIKPGDTVVVPLDTERLPTLPLWQAVTQILYNVAIAAAAVKSF